MDGKTKLLFERHNRIARLAPKHFKLYDRFAQIGYALSFALQFPTNQRTKEMENRAVELMEQLRKEMNTDEWREFIVEMEKP